MQYVCLIHALMYLGNTLEVLTFSILMDAPRHMCTHALWVVKYPFGFVKSIKLNICIAFPYIYMHNTKCL